MPISAFGQAGSAFFSVLPNIFAATNPPIEIITSLRYMINGSGSDYSYYAESGKIPMAIFRADSSICDYLSDRGIILEPLIRMKRNKPGDHLENLGIKATKDQSAKILWVRL